MISISYEDIFSAFLGNIEDNPLAALPASDAYALMAEYLHKTLADPYVSRLFAEYSLDDDEQVFRYRMTTILDDTADREFVLTALSRWMVYEWLQKRVQSVTNLTQMFAGKEQKFYSQAQHLSELRELQNDAYQRARYFIMNRGYIHNNYLSGSS